MTQLLLTQLLWLACNSCNVPGKVPPHGRCTLHSLFPLPGMLFPGYMLAPAFMSFESLFQLAFSVRLSLSTLVQLLSPAAAFPHFLAVWFYASALLISDVDYNLLIYLVCGWPPLTNVSSTKAGIFVHFVYCHGPCAQNSASIIGAQSAR